MSRIDENPPRPGDARPAGEEGKRRALRRLCETPPAQPPSKEGPAAEGGAGGVSGERLMKTVLDPARRDRARTRLVDGPGAGA